MSVDFTDKAVKDFDFLLFEPFRQFDRLMDQDFFYKCSDPAVQNGMAVAQRIKATLGITG